MLNNHGSYEDACRYTLYDINMHYAVRLASVTNKQLIMNENNKHGRLNLETHFSRRLFIRFNDSSRGKRLL